MLARRSLRWTLAGLMITCAGLATPLTAARPGTSGADERAALERTLAAHPTDRASWLRLARMQRAAGAHAAAAAAYDRALALAPDPRILYDAACAHARAGQREQAFVWLDQAAASGGIPVTQLDGDDDLASLRGDSRFAALRDKARRAFEPCQFQPEARQFDFWLGEWEVRPNGGQGVAGHSRVEKILSSCVLLENWTGTNGWSGKSFNIYDATEGRWHQTWVDQSGTLTHFLDGQWRDGALHFRSAPRMQGGQRTELRLTFHDLGPGRVRQHGQRSTDGGLTWQDQYDFIYERPAARPAASSRKAPQEDAPRSTLGAEAHALGKQIGHRERAHRTGGVAHVDLRALVRDGAGEDQLAPLQLGQREAFGVEAHVGEGRGVHPDCESGEAATATSARSACPKRSALASRP
jgi:hypothetical protein